MNSTALTRVETACAELARSGEKITFTAVAARTQIGRSTLYRDLELRAVIDEHRVRQVDSHSLSGLAADVAHLREAVDVLARNVRRHEEQLRKLTTPPRR